MNEPVSIIIPTRNRSSVLQKCLAALSGGARGLEPPEVLVVDDCSSDATPLTVQEFTRTSNWPVRCLRQEKPLGASAARNRGVKAAEGRIVVLIDDDSVVTEGWLAKLLDGLSKEWPVVTGAVRLTLDGPILGKHREEVSAYLSEVLAPSLGPGKTVVPVACNMAAFRWVFETAVFDENVRPPLEEGDWLRRAGVSVRFVPEAVVWHYKTPEEVRLNRVLRLAWRRGSEGGWWTRERQKVAFCKRLPLAVLSMTTSIRAFGHALRRRCWGGAVVGIGELSRALAIAGVTNHSPRIPKSWR